MNSVDVNVEALRLAIETAKFAGENSTEQIVTAAREYAAFLDPDSANSVPVVSVLIDNPLLSPAQVDAILCSVMDERNRLLGHRRQSPNRTRDEQEVCVKCGHGKVDVRYRPSRDWRELRYLNGEKVGGSEHLFKVCARCGFEWATPTLASCACHNQCGCTEEDACSPDCDHPVSCAYGED